MSRRMFWRWLLLGVDEWPWMSGRPLWQYLLLDWAIWVLAGLAAFAIATGILGHFDVWWLIVWIATGTLARPPLARRRWRRIQARVSPESADTQN